MAKYDELYEIGLQVDNLQQLNYQGVELPSLFTIIESLEGWFDQNDNLVDDNDKIIFNYTRANYMAVLIEIAKHHGSKVHDFKPYSQYKTGDDFLYDYGLRRLNLLREALDLYGNQQKPKISNTWMNQVRVNLANVYRETGRIVESLDLLEPYKNTFGMARINYAAKLYQLASYTEDEKVQKELLLAALFHYDTTIAQYHERKEFDPIPEDIFQSICVAKERVENELKTDYKDIPTICDPSEDFDYNLGIGPSEYKQWCRDKRLILSIRNLYQCASLGDDIHLPNMGIGYFARDNSLSYYSWYNTLKQEYNQARYYLYLTQEAVQDYDVHESQENIFLINTLDYPAVGYRTELLKSSLKTAYGVLDKIGLLCNDFVRGKNMPAYKINFESWFAGIEKSIRINNKFTSLYWVAQDLSRSGRFRGFRLLRNVLEHRYLRVVDHANIPLEEELSDTDKMEYVISYSDLQKQAYEILKLIRALLFYVVFAFNVCYFETIEMCERNRKIFLPLQLSNYDDEWKN